jgi:GTP-binding protein HflX
VDGADPDPFGQVAAVREVLSDIGAGDVAEQLVVNKVDAADPDALAALRTRFPDAVFVSARTGSGLDELRARLESRLPRPQVQVDVLVPYARGDLIDRIHREGELVAYEHTGLGTQVVARVGQALAAELAELS